MHSPRSRTKWSRLTAALASALALTSCDPVAISLGEDRPTPVSADYRIVAEVPPQPHTKLDLLFVVETGPGAADLQSVLPAELDHMLAGLQLAEDGLPDLHIGVITSDLGTADQPVQGCSSAGDDGVLGAGRAHDCSGLTAAYLTDKPGPNGGRDRNYSGDNLSEVVSCMTQLGDDGCRYPQPLQATWQALHHPANAGFLREDAALGIIIVGASDDCSVSDPTLFAADHPGAADDARTRCFLHGVICAGDDVISPGPMANCQALPAPEYLAPPELYASWLASTKTRPRDVAITTIGAAPATAHLAGTTNGKLRLESACDDGSNTSGYPAFRLAAFTERAGIGGALAPACSSPQSVARTAVRQLRKGLGTNCLDGYLSDMDPLTTAHETSCQVSELVPGNPAVAAFYQQPVAACDDTYDDELCFRVVPRPSQCADFPTRLAIELQRPESPPHPSRGLVVRCAVAPDSDIAPSVD